MPAPPPAPLVSVAIVNFNAGVYLVESCAALARQTFADFEAIVLDCASTDGSFAAAESANRDPRFRFVPLGANLGFAAANNRGAALARGRWFATLNPDAFPEPGWLEQLLAAATRHPGAGMFASTQVDAREPARLDGVGDAYHALGLAWRGGHGRPRSTAPAGDGEVFSPCGAAAFYDRAGFLALGGYDESFFCFMEDVDLGFRWRLAGGRAIHVSSAVVRHVGGGSGGTSAFARYHGLRNLVWTFVKNMPAALFWPLAPLHALAIVLLILRDIGRGYGSAAFAAARDAAVGLPAVWRKREAIQKTRRVPVAHIARAFAWSPLAPARRAAGAG